ncbi:disulfide bond formation protein B [Oxalobacteraceae bacterium]|nr:disulfide bond formation protein B [Oxalobacteraceae bacterium]
MIQSRPLFLSIAAGCFGALAVALYMQHGLDMAPCPYCIIQRYLFLAVAFSCLIGAASKKHKVGASLGLASALAGMGVAGKHLYILAHPGLSCGIDPVETALNKIPTAVWLPSVFNAYGQCEDATAPVLGLSIPQWSFLGFTVCAIALLVILMRRQRTSLFQ